MILDAQNMFSDSQAFTATAVGTNVVDLTVDSSVGTGEPVAVMFVVEVAADQTSGDEDYTFDVEYASDAAQTTGRQLVGRRIFESGTPTAPAQDADLLVAGFRFYIVVPPTDLSESEQYIGIRATLAGTTPTITVSSYIMPLADVDSTADYANNYTIV
jgi:hypothetical protein